MGASSNHLWTLTPPCFTLRAAGYGGSFFVACSQFRYRVWVALDGSCSLDRALAMQGDELVLGPLSRQQERMDRRLPSQLPAEPPDQSAPLPEQGATTQKYLRMHAVRSSSEVFFLSTGADTAACGALSDGLGKPALRFGATVKRDGITTTAKQASNATVASMLPGLK